MFTYLQISTRPRHVNRCREVGLDINAKHTHFFCHENTNPQKELCKDPLPIGIQSLGDVTKRTASFAPWSRFCPRLTNMRPSRNIFVALSHQYIFNSIVKTLYNRSVEQNTANLLTKIMRSIYNSSLLSQHTVNAYQTFFQIHVSTQVRPLGEFLRIRRPSCGLKLASPGLDKKPFQQD